MFKFDVRYKYENYLEYYKNVLIYQRIFRDLILSLVFVVLAVFWWVDGSENTQGHFLPIFALVMAVAFPLMSVAFFPMLKKQLRARQAEIDRTHILVTFDPDEVIYENQSEKAPEPVVEEVKSETSEESLQEEVSENKVEVKEEVVEEKKAEEKQEERIFKLNYQNFLNVKETKGLFLFYLDRQTVIILPKETFVEGTFTLKKFKDFILTKINPKRVKFLKENVEK